MRVEFDEGRAAYYNPLLQINPYPPATLRHREWQSGFDYEKSLDERDLQEYYEEQFVNSL